jgi:protein-S-isoprenylcysteine O-methyltransferase Ste14
MARDDTPQPPAAGAPLPPPLIVALVMAAGWGASRVAPLATPRGMVIAMIAGALGVLAVILLAGAVLAMHRAHTSVAPWDPTTTLLTTGVFGISRNPIYVAFLLVQALLALAGGNGWWLVLLPVSWYLLHVVQVRREERYLVKTFGDAYLDYARRVRRWL